MSVVGAPAIAFIKKTEKEHSYVFLTIYTSQYLWNSFSEWILVFWSFTNQAYENKNGSQAFLTIYLNSGTQHEWYGVW